MIPQRVVEGWIEQAAQAGFNPEKTQPSPLALNRQGRRATQAVLNRAVRQLKKQKGRKA